MDVSALLYAVVFRQFWQDDGFESSFEINIFYQLKTILFKGSKRSGFHLIENCCGKDALFISFSNEAPFFLAQFEKKHEFHEQYSDSFVSKRKLASLVSMKIR